MVFVTSWNGVVAPAMDTYTVGVGRLVVVVVVVVTCAAATKAVVVDVAVTVTGAPGNPRQEHALISASAAKRLQMEGRVSLEVPRICILATGEGAARPWRSGKGLSAFRLDMSSFAASRTSFRAVGLHRFVAGVLIVVAAGVVVTVEVMVNVGVGLAVVDVVVVTTDCVVVLGGMNTLQKDVACDCTLAAVTSRFKTVHSCAVGAARHVVMLTAGHSRHLAIFMTAHNKSIL